MKKKLLILFLTTITGLIWMIRNPDIDKKPTEKPTKTSTQTPMNAPTSEAETEVPTTAPQVSSPSDTVVAKGKVAQPPTAPIGRQERIHQIEAEIHSYENILASEQAIDRMNRNQVSNEERQHYFNIIKTLVSLRIKATDLKIEAIENKESGV